MKRRMQVLGLRDAYAENLRRLCPIMNGDNPWVTELAKLEAGEPLVVVGWALPDEAGVSRESLYQQFCLEPDGSLSPVYPVLGDAEGMARRVLTYRRPDGTDVYEPWPDYYY